MPNVQQLDLLLGNSAPKRIPTRICASIEELMKIKDVDEHIAKRVREVWHHERNRHDARTLIDSLIQTYGVEYLGVDKRSRTDVYYCNAGDPYAGTILFIGPRLFVGCWGDLVEANRIKPRGQY